MNEYGGNPSLASAVKERVTSTFQQALALYKQGRTDEVIAGCGLILQMDPLYDPARKLLDKARNPASAVNVESLGGPNVSESMAQARQAMQARDFERVVQLTTEILTNDLMNEEARVLADEAREKIESGPFVDQFIRKAEQLLAAGNVAGAKTAIEKARALDGGHPGLARITQQLNAAPGARPASDTSSFVVDAPPPPARGAAQASDFGFTFEEDKGAAAPAAAPFTNFSFDAPTAAPAAPAAPATGFGGGFSFETPGQPAANAPFAGFSFDTPAGSGAPSFGSEAAAQKAPATGEFDFSAASFETSPDDQKKIEQYLSDGDKAFEAGEYQQAIDLWSRIFLIDVTNEAASERIEKAKSKRNEIESRADDALAAGIQAFERKDFATAKTRFNEVLLADPNNATASDYLGRIAAGTTAAPVAAPVIPPSVPAARDIFDDEPIEGVYQEPVVPQPKAPAVKKVTKTAAPVAEKKKSTPLIAAAVAAVVLIAGGWFVWSKFFSSANSNLSTTQATISEATQLGQQGKYDLAISKLQDIKPGDAQYDKAMMLIAELQQKKNRASAMVDGRPAAVFYQENLAAGRTAFDAHDFVSAKKSFEQAMRVKALPPDMKSAYDTAAQQVAKLDTARTLFAERKYADVVSSLTPLLQQDPQNKNIQRMIVDAHFNLGATALQEERLTDAASEFEEVLKADPNDELARRSLDLARRYDNQTRDLLYKIYVKYLPLRQPPVG